MNEKLLQRMDELEQKAKENEAIIKRLEDQNHQLYSRLTEVVNLLYNNGISLNSKQANISNDDMDKSLNEVEELNDQVDEAIKGKVQNQYYEDIYSDSSFLKNQTIPSNEEVESIENPEIIGISSETKKKSDIKDNEHENQIDTTPFKLTMPREDLNLLKKYYPSVYSDDDFNIEEEPFEKSEGNQESMIDIDDLNKNKDNSEMNLDDTNNEYLGARVNLGDNLENQEATNEQEVDYEKGKGKKTPKIKNIRKAFNFQKIKTGIKKHCKKIVAAILVATATVSAIVSVAVNNNKDKDKDTVSIIQENDSDLPSKDATNEFGINTDDVLNNLHFNSLQNQEQGESNKTETVKMDIDSKSNDNEEKNTDLDTNYQESDKTYNVNVDNFSIGHDVKFNGEYIYQTSKDASQQTNKLHPTYTNDDKRSISAIQMVSPDGTQHVTITDNNKDEQNLLESMGWTVESYNVSNDTRNIEYEGWINNGDLEVSNGNHR